MDTVYVLEHSYEFRGVEYSKTIGIYSSFIKAKKVLEEYKEKPGFCNHKEGFLIDEIILDESQWKYGFVEIVTVLPTKLSYSVVQVERLNEEEYKLMDDLPELNLSKGEIVSCTEENINGENWLVISSSQSGSTQIPQ